MSGKFALIIANTEYSDSKLAELKAPGEDAEEFARALRSPDIAAFDQVNILFNEDVFNLNLAVEDFFAHKKPNDLLVLYFSGHGVRDEYGSLYLAVQNTDCTRLRATAIRSSYIREAMDYSRSKRQVLILDCCNSGAFAPGTKAEFGGSIGTASAFEGTGYGRVVLTASDSTQFAWEGDKVIGDTTNSLFTHFLVKGLEGEADRDGDGRITVDELYDYTYEQIVSRTPKQTPGKWSYKQQGEIVLRQNIRIEDTRPIPLPDDLIGAIRSSLPFVREGAVRQLEALLSGRNLGLARSARAALEKIAKEDDSRQVSKIATDILERIQEEEALAAKKAGKEKTKREAAKKAAKEKAEREAVLAKAYDEAYKEKAKRETAEKVAKEKAEREAILAKAYDEAYKEKAEREAAEKAAKEKAEREAVLAEAYDEAYKEKAEREAAEKVAREKAERERIERERLEREEKARKEKEAAEKAAREKAGRGSLVDESVQEPGKVEPHKIETRETARAFKARTIFGVGYAGIAGIIGVIGIIIFIIVYFSSITSLSAEISDTDPAENAIAMRLVPAGEFTMGGDADDVLADCQKYRSDCERYWFADQEPPHRVYLDAFYMDKYEVTNASYKACVDVGECSQPEKTGHYNDPEYTNHPVVFVNWIQARAYCKWRGGDLPSEAQWEKAARGTDERIYPWGVGIDCGKANYYYSAISSYCVGDTTEVGSYEKGVSPYGLYDMAGNVWEWVDDWYDAYPDNTEPSSDYGYTYRVLRGGSFLGSENSLLVSNRFRYFPDSHEGFIGFRCVRDTSP